MSAFIVLSLTFATSALLIGMMIYVGASQSRNDRFDSVFRRFGLLQIPVVRRRSDGTFWSPSGDTPFPLRGFNFVPAAPITGLTLAKAWRRDYSGERWITHDSAAFEIIVPPTH